MVDFFFEDIEEGVIKITVRAGCRALHAKLRLLIVSLGFACLGNCQSVHHRKSQKRSLDESPW
jgi:hypothetical protein